MPTDKESDCLTLNFYIMKNEREMLSQFRVEELEDRLEMGKWNASISGSSNGTVTATVGWQSN